MVKPAYSAHGYALDRCITWDVTIPRFHLTPTQKRKRIISIRFRVKNNSGKRLTVRVQVIALSKVIQFSSKKFKVLAKTRVHQETTSDVSVQKHRIVSTKSGEFQFKAYYLPQLAYQPVSEIAFEYSISAFDPDGKVVTHSHPIQIIIPLKKRN